MSLNQLVASMPTLLHNLGHLFKKSRALLTFWTSDMKPACPEMHSDLIEIGVPIHGFDNKGEHRTALAASSHRVGAAFCVLR